jgi:rifampicin phosphotransferase
VPRAALRLEARTFLRGQPNPNCQRWDTPCARGESVGTLAFIAVVSAAARMWHFCRRNEGSVAPCPSHFEHMPETGPCDKPRVMPHSLVMTKHSLVLAFEEIDQTQVTLVGGKGAHLGELSRLEGVRVPPGFCVTTAAFQRMLSRAPSIDERLERLGRLKADEREAIRLLSVDVRSILEATPMPGDVTAAITGMLARFGEDAAYAVRSSATAEDLPSASFAGQQDTYLNVLGPAAILEHVRRCWASLFTERAVTYRLRNGFEQKKVLMAVVVQRMVFARAAGILFTADPITGNRKIASVDASFGLGEALVSGLVNADVYKVRNDQVIDKVIAAKLLAIEVTPRGGTQKQAIAPERQREAALSDGEVVRLVRLGRRIEAHFGAPQDIEWCASGEGFEIVQSRPITTLFPIPAANDQENHVYISVGHQQMMTDAIKPLGLSFWQLTTPRPMAEAGGRLFVDVTRILATPASREGLLGLVAKSDPLMRDALETILARGDFIQSRTDEQPGWTPPSAGPAPLDPDATLPAELIARSEASIAAMKREIQTKSGTALLEFILADIQELRRTTFDPRGLQVIMTAMEATWWLNEKLEVWLGEKNAADTLTQSVPNNVTSEMGLALLKVADVIRPRQEVVAFLQQVEGDDFMDQLSGLAGGREARDAIANYLDKYGMRCTGEIDITRPRWSERPSALLPVLLGNIKTFEPGAGERRFEQGQQEAWNKEQELLARLRALPEGEERARETKLQIDRVRTFMGYREYPKYALVNRYFVYKQALLREAERLLSARLIRDIEDIFYLRFQELQEVLRTNQVADQLIRERKEAFRSYSALTPPRVLTSDGEAVTGSYRRADMPPGALLGLAVSAGTVEGRARVILDLAEAELEPGDILVTPYTDPSWTPLFVAISGLVTEVGGLMTHGAVIAREYGLPAVVGVQNATRLIRDRQRIRVHGTEGYVEIIE